MNIEILFRGKRKDNGEWIESRSILQFVYGAVYLNYRGTWVMVIPETVGQYVGFDDNNGKKIFDGDIARLSGWKPSVMCIGFIEGAFCLCNAKGEYMADIHYINPESSCDSEIIGNIHDNPELLEERK